MSFIKIVLILVFIISIVSMTFVITSAIVSSRISRMEEYEEVMRKFKNKE